MTEQSEDPARDATPQEKIWFVGAGPGDPELLTLKGKALLERAPW